MRQSFQVIWEDSPYYHDQLNQHEEGCDAILGIDGIGVMKDIVERNDQA